MFRSDLARTRSAAQFSREYGRFFGSAPAKDINRLREEGLASGDSAQRTTPLSTSGGNREDRS